ncbi:MAG TPA: putative selenate reductase subunit YgfK, partial [Spirochaetia bacterium]|nr:putative selenate reductase subunit YgfK [Spirochaetia bacterium]
RGPKGEFIFNMSVGYTLEGIKSGRVDRFIDDLMNPAGTAVWEETMDAARAAIATPLFSRAFGADTVKRMAGALERVPIHPVHSVTLSTMHGCPPDEIERIARHLIEEKGLSTYVKMNPTLLGYDRVRSILDATGWSDVHIERAAFEKDLQFNDALSLIASLTETAKKTNLQFGLKLSNTLANANKLGRLPGEEMYLSGRALFPITTALAAELASALPSPLPFSFCAGVSAMNAAECIRAGLGPLTVATDLLKPGGYLRLEHIAERAVEGLGAHPAPHPDAAELHKLAASALDARQYRSDWKEGNSVIKKELPLFDCFAAPCIDACPTHQNVPGYIRALAEGDGKAALEIVLADNPLPTVTGLVCDHTCTKACCRDDYEGAVDIRGVKLACARAAEIQPEARTKRNGVGKTAIFGSGPAGLSCAHYLALDGYPVVVFEKARDIGGVVTSTIPKFRISREDIQRDVDRIKKLGAEFRLGFPENLDIAALRSEGFTSFVVASGAPIGRTMKLDGDGVEVVGALEFLMDAAQDSDKYQQFRNIVVVGGGFTSLDAVRVAARFASNPNVKLVYRRTRTEMPAERGEVEAAIEEGVELRELSLPFRIEPGKVISRVMKLGAFDASGRRSPEPTDRTETFACDLLIEAIGEEPDRALLEGLGIRTTDKGRPVFDEETLETNVKSVFVAGDAARGPASIIQAIADGRIAANAILRSIKIEPVVPKGSVSLIKIQPNAARFADRGRIIHSLPLNPGETEANRTVTAEQVKREAERCLSCDAACLRCVEVCPNRANIAVPVTHGTGFTQSLQILHIDDLCNDCGACGFLCPYETKALPYKDKPTLFSSEHSFAESTNPGFVFLDDGRGEVLLRVHGETLKVSPVTADPVGNAASAAGMTSQDARDFRRMYDLAHTVHNSHSYLVESKTE